MGDAILRNKQLAIGNGAEYTNVFPLLHTLGVQDHWKGRKPTASASFCSRAPRSSASSASAPRCGRAMCTAAIGRSRHQVPPG
jgi:hypothetical protein